MDSSEERAFSTETPYIKGITLHYITLPLHCKIDCIHHSYNNICD